MRVRGSRGADIWSANGKRRHMSKGQLAMIAACSLEPKGQHGNQWLDTGKTKAATDAGVSAGRLSQALLVREHAPHLVADVITCSPALRGNSCIR
jgi:hypothetical protein